MCLYISAHGNVFSTQTPARLIHLYEAVNVWATALRIGIRITIKSVHVLACDCVLAHLLLLCYPCWRLDLIASSFTERCDISIFGMPQIVAPLIGHHVPATWRILDFTYMHVTKLRPSHQYFFSVQWYCRHWCECQHGGHDAHRWDTIKLSGLVIFVSSAFKFYLMCASFSASVGVSAYVGVSVRSTVS